MIVDKNDHKVFVVMTKSAQNLFPALLICPLVLVEDTFVLIE